MLLLTQTQTWKESHPRNEGKNWQGWYKSQNILYIILYDKEMELMLTWEKQNHQMFAHFPIYPSNKMKIISLTRQPNLSRFIGFFCTSAGMMGRRVWSSTPIHLTSLTCGEKRCCRTQKTRGRRDGNRRYVWTNKHPAWAAHNTARRISLLQCWFFGCWNRSRCTRWGVRLWALEGWCVGTRDVGANWRLCCKPICVACLN